MTSEHLTVDVVITGAGMVGLSMACLLAKQGKSVAVVDRYEVPTFNNEQDYEARVTAVSPGSQAIFEFCSAWHLMQQKRVSPYTAMVVWEELGHAKINFDAVEIQRSHLGHIVENIVIQSSLFDALQTQKNVAWYLKKSIHAVEVSADHIEMIFDNQERIQAKLIIGADGAKSIIRSLAGIAYQEKSYQQVGLVARVHTELPHEKTAWQRFLPTGPLALLPLNNGECSIVWSVSDDYADDLMRLNEYEFADALTEASDRQLGNIELRSKCAGFPLISGQADCMVQPRIALIGDAAHALHPLAGQGANLGFTDAAVLSNVIATTKRDIGSYKVLRKYERARIGETLLMQRAMDAFVTTFGATQKPVVSVRNTALHMADRIQPIKRFFMTHAMGLNQDRPEFAR